jgi:predicted dehydrogenase
MNAGMHVFCEKPMTVDIDEAKDLVATVTESKKTFMCNTTANWRGKTKRAMKMVESGQEIDLLLRQLFTNSIGTCRRYRGDQARECRFPHIIRLGIQRSG